jgi:hypothetical protein
MYTITYADNDKVLMTTANSDSLIAHAIKHLLDGRATDHGEINVFNTENHDLIGVLKAKTAVDKVTKMCHEYRQKMCSFNPTFEG